MMSSSPKISQNLVIIEKELCSFYDYCKENGFTSEEIQQICRPLAIIITKAKIIKLIRYFLFFIIFFATLYYFFQLEIVSWHATALGRIAMIKMLPYWDWRQMSTEKCLFKKSTNVEKDIRFNCVLCEAVDEIPLHSNIDPELLNEIYLKVHLPAIITDGLRDWPTQMDHFNMTETIVDDRTIRQSLPCEMSTNMLSDLVEIKNVLKWTTKYEKWFFHLQNCEIEAVKSFRIITPRPYFLAPEISPVQYSWLLMSSRYKAPRFKSINLRERITVVAQIRGSNLVRLLPRKNCAEECQTLETELKIGEALVFSSLWDFEYKPKDDSYNIAVILEMN